MKTLAIISGIVHHQDQYLLLKRSANNYSGNDWEFIMGFIEPKEYLEDAVLREVKEETGLTGIISKFLPTVSITGSKNKYIIFPFLITVNSKVISLSEEHSDYVWVSKNSILEYQGTIKELVKLL